MTGTNVHKGHIARACAWCGKKGAASVAASGGFSLVELMIAMVILLFVALAMMQVAMMTMNSNTRNVIRDEGTRLASDRLSGLRYVDAGDLDAVYDGSTGTVDRQIRNMTVEYTVTNTVTTLASDIAVRIDVEVGWSWKGQDFDITLSTIREL